MILFNFISLISRIIIISFPFLLISGPFLPDLAAVLIGISYLIFAIKRRNFEECNNYIIYFLIIIFIYINLNSFFSFSPKISFSSSLPFFRIILFILGLIYFLNTFKQLKLYFFYSCCLSILILLIDSIFQYYSGFNLIGLKADITRISSFFGNELIMGSFVARILPLIIGLSFLIKLNHIKKIRYLILLFSFILILLSGERTSLVFFFFTLILINFLDFDKRIFTTVFIILLLPIFLLNFYDIKPLKRIFYHTYKQLSETQSIFNFSYRHHLHFYTADKIFNDSKIIGKGIKSFRFLCSDPKFSARDKILHEKKIKSFREGYFYFFSHEQINYVIFSVIKNEDFTKLINKENFKDSEIYTDSNQVIIRLTENFFQPLVKSGTFVKQYDDVYVSYEFHDGCNTHPHNLFWQILSELGILGFLLFFIIFIFSIYKILKLLIKKIKNNLSNIEKFKTFIYLSIFISIFPFTPSGNFFHNWLLIINHLPVGFYLATRDKLKI